MEAAHPWSYVALTPLPDGQHLCRNMDSLDRGSVEIEGGTLSGFAGLLGMALNRPVIDKAGITGYFEIHLVFSPDTSVQTRRVTAHPGASAAVRAPDARGIFQAIQEQLGLRLMPAKGPVDVLVTDRILRPSETETTAGKEDPTPVGITIRSATEAHGPSPCELNLRDPIGYDENTAAMVTCDYPSVSSKRAIAEIPRAQSAVSTWSCFFPARVRE